MPGSVYAALEESLCVLVSGLGLGSQLRRPGFGPFRVREPSQGIYALFVIKPVELPVHFAVSSGSTLTLALYCCGGLVAR